MDFLDKAKDLAKEHGDKVDDILDKVADLVDDKTGGKHHEKIESAVDKAKSLLGRDDKAGGGKGGGRDDKAGGGQEPPSKLTS